MIASALRVLIVDDQLTSRLLIREGLQDLGISNIEWAGNGEEGMKMLLAKPAHLIISDLNMPKLDGLGFLRAVRSVEATKKTGFILLTGKGDDKEVIARAAKLGANNVIAKPFTMPMLGGMGSATCLVR